MIFTILIYKPQVSSYNLWKFESITFSIKNLMGLLTSAMLGARTADQSADLPKPVQKTVECLRYDRIF